ERRRRRRSPPRSRKSRLLFSFRLRLPLRLCASSTKTVAKEPTSELWCRHWLRHSFFSVLRDDVPLLEVLAEKANSFASEAFLFFKRRAAEISSVVSESGRVGTAAGGAHCTLSKNLPEVRDALEKDSESATCSPFCRLENRGSTAHGSPKRKRHVP